ncbi:MAG: hypothetical protein QJR12_16905 [Mycobacterium sp.]|uniref:hypothetical protein n=1 Tax=Mycobacterium sp. TaxID=1785 RepID=UPI00262A43E0|nr:hypothetical protein [Mycobacterium sp.]MDI3315887.1 hypothetical protein [Mycobacterium sp.]
MSEQDRIDELSRTCIRIEQKVDRIDEKLDGHATTLAQYGVRIDALERHIQRNWERVAVWLGVLAALVAAILPDVVH